MSQHHEDTKAHEAHSLKHEAHSIKEDQATKCPHNPKEINPKMTSDIAYWSREFGVTGDQGSNFSEDFPGLIPSSRHVVRSER